MLRTKDGYPITKNGNTERACPVNKKEMAHFYEYNAQLLFMCTEKSSIDFFKGVENIYFISLKSLNRQI
jgi:hypothetical protein